MKRRFEAGLATATKTILFVGRPESWSLGFAVSPVRADRRIVAGPGDRKSRLAKPSAWFPMGRRPLPKLANTPSGVWRPLGSRQHRGQQSPLCTLVQQSMPRGPIPEAPFGWQIQRRRFASCAPATAEPKEQPSSFPRKKWTPCPN